jgi:Na+/H+ antiporter NhaD/arsenite permease-like protein
LLTTLIVIFLIAYSAIILEHPLKVNKSASALIGAGLLWTIYAVFTSDHKLMNTQLGESLQGTAQVVFFLMGAMTIVEVVDAHNGFEVITSRIKTTSLTALLWIVGVLTFFLSALLDNLTSTIVMISLLKRLLDRREDRLFFAGIVIIAANAGGAWSPIGDVTTTMLWIGGKITPWAITKGVILPSIINMVVPLTITGWFLKKREVISPASNVVHGNRVKTTPFEQIFMFAIGLGILACVPIFNLITHLPPYMGILFGLGILWLAGELIHSKKDEETKEQLTLVRALKQIDMSSIVFFIGILLAVAPLEHTHILSALATWLDRTLGREDVIVTIFGLLSSILDNVPLVAASMGMYSMTQHPADSLLWEFLAYCAGTGGSILIIGSAAGVAAMGLEKINFFWYVRRIAPLALIGYFCGIAAYIFQYNIIH